MGNSGSQAMMSKQAAESTKPLSLQTAEKADVISDDFADNIKNTSTVIPPNLLYSQLLLRNDCNYSLLLADADDSCSTSSLNGSSVTRGEATVGDSLATGSYQVAESVQKAQQHDTDGTVKYEDGVSARGMLDVPSSTSTTALTSDSSADHSSNAVSSEDEDADKADCKGQSFKVFLKSPFTSKTGNTKSKYSPIQSCDG